MAIDCVFREFSSWRLRDWATCSLQCYECHQRSDFDSVNTLLDAFAAGSFLPQVARLELDWDTGAIIVEPEGASHC